MCKTSGLCLGSYVQVGAVVGVEWYWNTLKNPKTILIVAVRVVVSMIHVLGSDPIQHNITNGGLLHGGGLICDIALVWTHMTYFGFRMSIVHRALSEKQVWEHV